MPDGVPSASPEAFDIIDYLGQLSPAAFEAQPGLPVAGPSVPAAPDGQGGGVAAGGPVVGQEGGGRPGALEPSGGPGVMQLVGQGLKLADVARGLLPSAAAAGAGFPQAGAPLMGEIAAGGAPPSDVFNPNVIGGGLTAGAGQVPADVAAGLDVAYGGTGAASAGLAEALPYIGAAIGIGTTLAGDRPPQEKLLDTAAYAAAPFTFGITALIPTLVHSLGIEKELIDALETVDPGFKWFGSLFEEGLYAGKRAGAAQQGQQQLGALGSAYQTAAKTGDPSAMFRAIEEAPGIRAYLSLPEAEARQLGLERTPEGLIGWPQVYDPAKGNALLDLYAQRPELIDLIQASGDIPYLEAGSAAGLAGQVGSQAKEAIRFLVQQRQAGEAPAAPMTGGPVSVPVPGAEGPRAGGGPLDVEELLGAAR